MSEAAETLAAVIAVKPGGETRPGHEAMCAAVDAALASGEHLLVEAPTGVGKSLAYLAPAVAHARSGPDAGCGGHCHQARLRLGARPPLVGDETPDLGRAACRGPPGGIGEQIVGLRGEMATNGHI